MIGIGLKKRTGTVCTSTAWWLASVFCFSSSAVLAETPTLPTILPPSDKVMEILQQSPQVQMALAGIPLAQARQQRLQLGPHEWAAKMAINRRHDNQSGRFTEAEVGLETGVRWPDKAAADQALGTVELTLGQLGHADAWHEAGRSLLTDWFDALRQARSATLLEAQHQLVVQQLGSTERRVQAGEAALLELQSAQAEEARIQALAVRARMQSNTSLLTLQRMYPGLPSPAAILPVQTSPLPPSSEMAEGSVAQWVEHILADNHELELAQAKAKQAKLQADRSALEQQGDPTLGVRSARERGGQERVWGIYLSISLGSAGRQADRRAAMAQAEIATHELDRTRQRLETDAWRVASEVEQTRTTRTQLQHALTKIERSAALQARAYELGESPLADLLLARRNALEGLLAADSAVLDEMQAQARLLLDTHQLWQAPHAEAN